MSKKGYRISKEIKEQVLNRIKNEGVSVANAAKDHGISTHTIYKLTGTPNLRHFIYTNYQS